MCSSPVCPSPWDDWGASCIVITSPPHSCSNPGRTSLRESQEFSVPSACTLIFSCPSKMHRLVDETSQPSSGALVSWLCCVLAPRPS